MSIVVVGSIAFDSIKTPFGQRRSLGGAANYFSIAARFFAPVKMVGVIGEDFPQAHLDYLKSCGIDIDGVERATGKSFHWQGEYGYDLNEARTISTELNVFEHFFPTLPNHYRDPRIVFLANIDPDLQMHVLRQLRSFKVRALDTMNFWIKGKSATLRQAISMVDILFVNDAEIRLLTEEHNIIKAARSAQKIGARIVVIKRGEYGALLCFDNEIAFVPAYPLEDVFDPTGAGDTFAGGFLGHLAKCSNINLDSLKQAMIIGAVMSSYVIESFSFDRLLAIDERAILNRKNKLVNMIKIAQWTQ